MTMRSGAAAFISATARGTGPSGSRPERPSGSFVFGRPKRMTPPTPRFLMTFACSRAAFTGNCEIALAAPVAHGNDNGLKDFHVTTEDAINGTTLKDGTDYYFGVTSYAVNLAALANKVIESPIKAVTVRPQRATSTVTAGMILAVPNPYYAHSAYEQSQFARRIRFLNCPAQCTIRIYNLAGQLVRTLSKNDPTTSVVDWDIQTSNNLPVGSGIYIAHVDSPGGSAIVRVAVFMEKERLNNF